MNVVITPPDPQALAAAAKMRWKIFWSVTLFASVLTFLYLVADSVYCSSLHGAEFVACVHLWHPYLAASIASAGAIIGSIVALAILAD